MSSLLDELIDKRMEQYMLKYAFQDATGGDFYPFEYTPNRMLKAVKKWANATNRPAGEPFTFVQLGEYLQDHYARFVAGWLRVCSAVARHSHYADELDKTSYDTEELASKLYREAKDQKENCFNPVDKVKAGEAINAIQRIMNSEGGRRELLIYSGPLPLIENLIAVDDLKDVFSTEFNTADIANLAMLINCFETIPEDAAEELEKLFQKRPAMHRACLPKWLRLIAETVYRHPSLKPNTYENRKQLLDELRYKHRDIIPDSRRSEAMKALEEAWDKYYKLFQ